MESRWAAKARRFRSAAGIASVLGRLLGLRNEQVKKLIPVGAAAAIAAAFNTPLAAVLFALEEIMGDLNAPVMGAVVLASATSWMVLRVVPRQSILSSRFRNINWSIPAEFAVYAVLGVAGGVVSVAFTKLLLGMRARFLRFPAEHGLVSTAGGRIAGRPDGLVCAAGSGRGLRVCRRRVERKDGVPSDGAAGGFETCSP